MILSVEWAEIPVVDLSKAQTPEGRQELMPLVRDAFRTYGFIYGINHSYTTAQVREPIALYTKAFNHRTVTERSHF